MFQEIFSTKSDFWNPKVAFPQFFLKIFTEMLFSAHWLVRCACSSFANAGNPCHIKTDSEKRFFYNHSKALTSKNFLNIVENIFHPLRLWWCIVRHRKATSKTCHVVSQMYFNDQQLRQILKSVFHYFPLSQFLWYFRKIIQFIIVFPFAAFLRRRRMSSCGKLLFRFPPTPNDDI